MFIVARENGSSPREGWNVYSSHKQEVLTPGGVECL